MKLDLLVLIFIIFISPALAFAHPGHVSEDILLLQANEAFNQENFEKAMSLLDTLLEHNPNNIGALNNKGVILNIQENFVEAQSYFDKALEINPAFVNALNNKAELLIKLEKYEEAFTPLNQVMKIDPGNKKAIANLEFIEFRLDYNLIDGFMEIQIYNSQGYLVTHFVSGNLWLLNNTLAEDVINTFPVKKTINRDGQEYEVLQRKGVIAENADSTPGRTGFSFSYNSQVMLVYSTHYQFVVEKGDVFVYYTTIFRSVQ